MASPKTPEMRKDRVLNRWVIFSPARARRPSDFKSKSPANPNNNSSTNCPFCLGREHECAPEIFRIPADTSDWKIRVIENLYPALHRDQPFTQNPNPNSSYSNFHVSLSGFGFHDVVIETPVHGVHLCDAGDSKVAEVLLAYKKRILQLQLNESIQYIQVFKNHGASAGASMTHSHSQIIGLPIVPPTVSARLESTKAYFDETGKCGLCEVQCEDLLIKQSKHFFAIAPFAASFPFEIWIVPRYHSAHFHELDGDDKAADLGGILKLMLLKLSRQLNDPPFNYMIHTSPLKTDLLELPYTHWFIQIVPQLSGIGGFEIGSGCYINPVFPEDAAKVLREVEV